MNVKREPVEYEPDAEDQHWFEVPIVSSNFPNEHTYIKQENSDDDNCTFKNVLTNLENIKCETDSQRVDSKDGSQLDLLNYEDKQPGCSYSECSTGSQFIDASKVTVIDARKKTEQQKPYEDIQIDEQQIKKEIDEHNERFTNTGSIYHTDKHLVTKSVVEQAELSVAVIKLEKTSFQKKIVCSICFDFFESLDLLDNHKNKNKKQLQCSDCNFSCIQLSNMKTHILTHSDENTSKYEDDCTQSSNMNSHKLTNYAVKLFKCDKCQFSSIESCKLKLHKITHHGEKQLECDQSKLSTVHIVGIKKYKMAHSDDKPFKCDACSFSCKQSNGLKIHKMIHTGEKPLKCDECSYSCRQPSQMRVHKMTHSGEKLFKCSDCNYSCIESRSMKLHRASHSCGNKPFKCDICGFSCEFSNRMIVHKKVHKLFKCSECSYSTYKSRIMILHEAFHSDQDL